MKKITIEIIKIISATLLMACGLILILTYLDGRLIIGLIAMAAGSLMWTLILREAVVQK
jgi:hypothetical protein